MLRCSSPNRFIPVKVMNTGNANGSLYIISKHCYYPSKQSEKKEKINAEYKL